MQMLIGLVIILGIVMIVAGVRITCMIVITRILHGFLVCLYVRYVEMF